MTSGADIFPFNTPANTDHSNGLLHPTNSAGTYLTPDYAHGLGSDESLGGALLTPIPWLSNASFDGGDSSAMEAGMFMDIVFFGSIALVDVLLIS